MNLNFILCICILESFKSSLLTELYNFLYMIDNLFYYVTLVLHPIFHVFTSFSLFSSVKLAVNFVWLILFVSFLFVAFFVFTYVWEHALLTVQAWLILLNILNSTILKYVKTLKLVEKIQQQNNCCLNTLLSISLSLLYD